MLTVFVFAVKQRIFDSLFHKYDRFASANGFEDWNVGIVLFLAFLIAFFMVFMLCAIIVKTQERIKKLLAS